MDEPRETTEKAMITKPIKVEKRSRTSSRGLVHFHEAYELSLFEHCDARLFLKNNWYEVHNGDVVFVPCNTIHRFQFLEIDRYNRIVINFQPEFIMKMLEAFDCESLISFYDSLKYHKTSLLPHQFKHVYDLGTRLLTAYEKMNESAENEAVALSMLFILLCELKPSFREAQLTAAIPVEKSSTKILIDYIDTGFGNDIKLDDLASLVHIDKYHLCRQFKRDVGTTLVKYLQHRRIIEAQKMLMFSNTSIDAVASRCGFNSIQHFYKVFRSISGFTPVQYRMMRRAD